MKNLLPSLMNVELPTTHKYTKVLGCPTFAFSPYALIISSLKKLFFSQKFRK